MFVYIGLAASELFLHVLYEKTPSSKNKRTFWIIGCFLMWSVIGFRAYNMGNDTIGYVRTFLNLSNTSWPEVLKLEYRDIGFFYLVKAISWFGSSPAWFLCATSFLSLIGIWDITWRNSSQPLFTLFFHITLGNFLFALTGIRQAIAMSMCMLSVRFIQNRKIIPFVILVLLGAACHHSAYLFLPMYILAIRKINVVSVFNNILITIVAFFAYERLLAIVNIWLNYDYGVEELDNGWIFYSIVLIVVMLGIITKQKWITDKKQTIIMNLGITSAILWTFRLIGRTAERPSMYWLNAIPIVLTNGLNSINLSDDGRSRILIKYAAVVLSLLLLLRRSVNLPFAFFWQ